MLFIFLTIVDDFSIPVWTYLLLAKSEVHTIFMNFTKMMERQFNKTVKMVRSDNETVYVFASILL